MITFDGKGYDINVNGLTRGFTRVTAVDGYLQSGDRFIDPKGTFINYEMTVSANAGRVEELDRFFDEMLSKETFFPLVVPYNQSEMTFMARITQASQALIDSMRNSPRNTWGPITVKFESKSPIRRPL